MGWFVPVMTDSSWPHWFVAIDDGLIWSNHRDRSPFPSFSFYHVQNLILTCPSSCCRRSCKTWVYVLPNEASRIWQFLSLFIKLIVKPFVSFQLKILYHHEWRVRLKSSNYNTRGWRCLHIYIFVKFDWNSEEGIIAEVAVTKRHQRLDEMRIIFTHTSSKSCFPKKYVMQYSPSTLNAIQLAQHTLARLL